jgi:hypothetical protein
MPRRALPSAQMRNALYRGCFSDWAELPTKKKVSELSAGDVVVLHSVPVLLSTSRTCPTCAPNRVIGEEARADFHGEHNYASVAYAKELMGGIEGPDGYVWVSGTLSK